LILTLFYPTFRFHSFNSWAAAQRLAAYWKFRFEVFGHRALLPMDLSGKGAIPPEDVRLLMQSGVLMMLPNDSSGRSVLYMDRSKLLEDESISPAVLFFVQQRLMENEMSGNIGCTTLLNLSNPFGATFQPRNVALAKDIVRKAMPLRVGRVHIVCSFPVRAGHRSFVSSCKSIAGFVRSIRYLFLWGCTSEMIHDPILKPIK